MVLLRVLSGGEKVHLALVNLSEIALWLFGDRLVEGSEVAVGFGIAGFGDKAARTISAVGAPNLVVHRRFLPPQAGEAATSSRMTEPVLIICSAIRVFSNSTKVTTPSRSTSADQSGR